MGGPCYNSRLHLVSAPFFYFGRRLSGGEGRQVATNCRCRQQKSIGRQAGMRLREAAIDFLAYFLGVFQNLCDSLLSDTIFSHAEMSTFPWWKKKAVCVLAFFFLESPEASFLADPLVVGHEWKMSGRGEITSVLPTMMCCTECL